MKLKKANVRETATLLTQETEVAEVIDHPLWARVVDNLDARMRGLGLAVRSVIRMPFADENGEVLSLGWGYHYRGDMGRVDVLWVPSESTQRQIFADLGLIGQLKGQDEALIAVGGGLDDLYQHPEAMAFFIQLRNAVERSGLNFVQKASGVGRNTVNIRFVGPLGTVILRWHWRRAF